MENPFLGKNKSFLQFCKKVLDFLRKVRIIINVLAIEDLCNGSTPDSDSVCGGSNPSSPAKMCGLNDCNLKTARVSSGFPVFIPKIIARFSWMQNTYMMDSNDRLSLDNMHYLYYNLFRGD